MSRITASGESVEASGVESRITQQKTAQFVGFRLAEQHYAVRIEQIQEIVILDQITETPQVADFVLGVSNLRGEIIPIIDLRKLMGLEHRSLDAETRTVVFNLGERTIGCVVDTVTQVIRIPAEKTQPPPETVTASGANYISGFARLDDQLLILLEISELLDPSRLGIET
jgi:purine-binding chemotaxis protein CheW